MKLGKLLQKIGGIAGKVADIIAIIVPKKKEVPDISPKTKRGKNA